MRIILEHRHGHQCRSQGRAQLVAENGKEVILGFTGLLGGGLGTLGNQFCCGQSLLRKHTVGDVERHAAHAAGSASRARNGKLVDERMMRDAIGLAQHLCGPNAPLPQGLPVVLAKPAGSLGRKKLIIGLAGKFDERPGKDALGFRIGIEVAPLHVLDPRRTWQVIHEGGKALLAFVQRRLCLSPARDIAEDHHQTDIPAIELDGC